MDDGGSRFRVPRQGLSERTEAMIRGSGAKPKSYAVGGGVDALPERMDAGPVAYAVGEQGAPPIDEPAPLPVPGMEMRPGDSVPPPGPQYAPPIPIEQERALTAPVPEMVMPAAALPKPKPKVIEMPVEPIVGRSQMELAREDIQDAETEKAAAIQQKADAEAALYAAHDRQLKDQAALQQEVVKQGLRKADEFMAGIRKARDDAAKIDVTVDPGRFWATRTTGQKIAGIVGLALGALGAGNDGVNRAAGMLQQAIDRDLEAQKAEHTMRLQKGKEAVDTASSLYAMNRQMTQDEIALNAANNASAWAIIENQFKKAEATAQGPIAQANAKAGAAMARQKAAEWDDGAKNRALEIGIKQGELGVQQYRAKTDRMKLEQDRAAAAASAGVPAVDEKDVQKLAKEIGDDPATIGAGIKRLRSMIAGKDDIPGIGKFDSVRPDLFQSDEGIKIRDQAQDLADVLLRMQSGAGVSDKERANAYRKYGINGADERAFINGMERLEADLKAKLEAKKAGFTPETVRVYESRGGTRVGEQSEASPAASQSGTVTIRSKSGSLHEVPAADAQQVLANNPGSEVVR
jgi:hypothetical protein